MGQRDIRRLLITGAMVIMRWACRKGARGKELGCIGCSDANRACWWQSPSPTKWLVLNWRSPPRALIDVLGQGFDAGVRLADTVPPDMIAVPILPTTPTYLASIFSTLPLPCATGLLRPKRLFEVDGQTEGRPG